MCRYCATYDFTKTGFRAPLDEASSIYLCLANSTAPKEDRFRFCPMCGEQIKYEEMTNSGRE